MPEYERISAHFSTFEHEGSIRAEGSIKVFLVEI